MSRLSAHVTMRAVKADIEPLAEETHAQMAADEFENLARELQAFAAVAGWTLDVLLVRESQCRYRALAADLPENYRALWGTKCPDRATQVVGGSDYCDRHAAGARRLLADLRSTA